LGPNICPSTYVKFHHSAFITNSRRTSPGGMFCDCKVVCREIASGQCTYMCLGRVVAFKNSSRALLSIYLSTDMYRFTRFFFVQHTKLYRSRVKYPILLLQYQTATKYTTIFHSKAFSKIPNLEFWV
jgi:hypothetical protein